MIPVKGIYWSVSYGREATQLVIDTAVSAGMYSCYPPRQEPTSDVFARGTAQKRVRP